MQSTCISCAMRGQELHGFCSKTRFLNASLSHTFVLLILYDFYIFNFYVYMRVVTSACCLCSL